MRQRVFTESEIHHHSLAPELDLFRRRPAAGSFDGKHARATRPILHTLVRFDV